MEIKQGLLIRPRGNGPVPAAAGDSGLAVGGSHALPQNTMMCKHTQTNARNQNALPSPSMCVCGAWWGGSGTTRSFVF